MRNNNNNIQNEHNNGSGIENARRAEIKRILRGTLPFFFMKMLDSNLIDLQKSNDKEYLFAVLEENLDAIAPNVEFIIDLHKDFVEIAKYCLEVEKPMVSVVLISTAVEHIINQYYRVLLSNKKLTEEQITDILRKANFEAKLGWLLSITNEVSLPPELQSEIREVIELRNVIVHHKYIPGNLDTKKDSHQILKERLEKVDIKTFLKLPRELEIFLTNELYQAFPNIRIAFELIDVMFPEE